MSTAQEMYSKYLKAETALLEGQKVKMGERELTRADLAEVRKGRQEWERKLSGKPHSVVNFV